MGGKRTGRNQPITDVRRTLAYSPHLIEIKPSIGGIRMAFCPSFARGAAQMALAAVLLSPNVAWAQDGDGPIGCDPNLNPAVETEAQREQRVFCETHAGCRFVMAAMRTGCRVRTFFDRLTRRDTPSRELTSDEVADAATPAHPSGPVADRALSEARAASRPAPNRPIVRESFSRANGRGGYVEADTTVMHSAPGTIIYSDGRIARGTTRPYFDDRILNGRGQTIFPNGHMQAGTYDNEGRLAGAGFYTATDANGRNSILEGTFGGGMPVGEMVRRYADGTSRRELWRRGEMIAHGELSLPGGVPPRLAPRPIPVPTYRAYMLEGSYRDTEGDQARILLWCNGQLIAAGEFGPYGRAVHPQPRECPNPGSYRNGSITVVGPDFRMRDEFWCRGRMVTSTPWYNHGPSRPWLPRDLRCDEPPQMAATARPVQSPARQEISQDGLAARLSAQGGDPLIVRGPPYPCSRELDDYLATGSRNNRGRSQEFWSGFQFNVAHVLTQTLTARQHIIQGAYQAYLSRVPAARSQTLIAGRYPESFYRDRQAMLDLNNAMVRDSESNPVGSQLHLLPRFHGCLARYLADNART